jgi:hypothetical protein
MIENYITNVKYDVHDDLELAVIYLPKDYWVGSWGAILDLIRCNILNSLKFIALDFSKVNNIIDCGLEPLILLNEFKEKGGKSIFNLNIPNELKVIWNKIDGNKELLKIHEFENLNQLIDFLKKGLKF